MSKAYTVPTPFASTPRKMSKPDQSPRQDLTNPLPSDAVSKVHLNTRCYYGVQNSLLFTAWHSDCLLFWVCNPNWCQITHFVTHKIKYIFHKQIFNNIFSQAHFLQHFTREIFHKFCPLLQDFLVSPAILTYCITNPTFSYFCLKFPVHLPKIW